MKLEDMIVGMKVRITKDVDYYPTGLFTTGMTGLIIYLTPHTQYLVEIA